MFVQKPDWANIRPLINADMIEIQKGYDTDISNRSFEMLCNEEAKMTNMIVKNNRATKAWYEWQRRTGRKCLPGDFIAGDVAILKKVYEPNETEQEVSVMTKVGNKSKLVKEAEEQVGNLKTSIDMMENIIQLVAVSDKHALQLQSWIKEYIL